MGQLLDFVNRLNPAQRAVIMGGVALLFVFLVGLLVYSKMKAQDEKLSYTVASDLTKSQVMAASDELEASNIPFMIIGSGNSLTIKTNKAHINVARIKLITSEAAVTKHSGWEIFEKSSLGTTSFENKIKYLRAIEGELSRTLESLSGVFRAEVKVAMPKETIFTGKKRLPTASSILTLKPGVFLTQKQVAGIKRFIASSVPDLKMENVSLVDQNGSPLEQDQIDMDNHKFISQEKYKRKIEKTYENKIIALIEPIIGTDRVVARVTVDLDFSKKVVTKEEYAPEGTIRSQQTNETVSQSEESKKENSGVPGADSNIQDPAKPAGVQAKAKSEGAKETTNYEISKSILSEKDDAYARIVRITAAVTFDSDSLKNIQDKDKYVKGFEDTVKSAISYDPNRKDQVSVRDFKFMKSLDKDGKPIVNTESTFNTFDTSGATLFRTLMMEFSEYIKYIIASVLLFIFYKKFIATNEVLVLNDKSGGSEVEYDENGNAIDTGLESEFDSNFANNSLKARVKSQILNNIDGLDEESSMKYEVFVEELEKTINQKPEEIAQLLEALLQDKNKFGSAAKS
jgi:flagellar M-ring protein FliF